MRGIARNSKEQQRLCMQGVALISNGKAWSKSNATN
nr:MAG TPA: hypothetical protein [Caudoviricetes sp.]